MISIEYWMHNKDKFVQREVICLCGREKLISMYTFNPKKHTPAVKWLIFYFLIKFEYLWYLQFV